jgi:ribosomal-protein-alanine N-acetyltransferase
MDQIQEGGAALLETTRLRLRAIRPSDFGELFRMNSDPLIMKYVGDGSTRGHEQMLKEMEMLIAYYAKRPGLGVWAVELKDSSEFTGAAGLTYNADKAEIELGYRLLTGYWNKGYATEAAQALLNYAFRNLKADKVIASAHAENVRSQMVLERIGMKQTGNGIEFNCAQKYYEVCAHKHL